MFGDGFMWMDGELFWGFQFIKGVLNGFMLIDCFNDMVVCVVVVWYQFGQDDEELFDRKGLNFFFWINDRLGVIVFVSGLLQEKVVVNQFVEVQGNYFELVC